MIDWKDEAHNLYPFLLMREEEAYIYNTEVPGRAENDSLACPLHSVGQDRVGVPLRKIPKSLRQRKIHNINAIHNAKRR